MEDNSVTTAKKQPTGRPFTKDDPRINRNGRPVGSKDYKTLFKEAIIKIAESKGQTPEEIENDLYKAGILNAIKGNAVFYKDAMDRLHGKPVSPIDMKMQGTIINEVKLRVIKAGDEEPDLSKQENAGD